MGAWRTSGYLLNYGSEYDSISESNSLRPVNEKRKPYLEDFLKHDKLSDTVRVSCLAPYCEDLDSFVGMVGRIWPHNQFYTEALEAQRLDLAMVLVSNVSDTLGPGAPSPDIFQHICRSLSLEQTEDSTAMYILSHLSVGLGHAAWQNLDLTTKWYRTILDTATRLDRALLMPEKQIQMFNAICVHLHTSDPEACIKNKSAESVGGRHKAPPTRAYLSECISLSLHAPRNQRANAPPMTSDD